jgi:hypothetical protein
MAAATVESHTVTNHGGLITQTTIITSMTSGTAADVPVATTYGAPNKTAPNEVYAVTTVAATTGVVTYEHTQASDSVSGNTVCITPRVEVGGNIASAKAKVVMKWINVARQDGQSISSDNNS